MDRQRPPKVILIREHKVALKEKGLSNVRESFYRAFQKDMNRVRTREKTASYEAINIDSFVGRLKYHGEKV
jgi:hypothetical protein